MRKIAFYTLGCRANQAQTEVIKSEVAGRKSRVVDFHSEADTYVINTCTVTADADRKSRQAIRRAMRQNPKAKVIATGCYAKLQAEELAKDFPKIEILLPSSLPPYPSPLSPRIRANLMIQDGCEHFCSYCIVPYARGRIKSKPLEQIIAEANQLVKAGAREIVLTGINLGTYQFDLPAAIHGLSSIKNLFRIRLSSLEPMYLSKELIDAVAETPQVCRHLHIPLQSGDNNILKAMNRNYSRDDYLDLIDYIRSKMPDCGITTDIIVGFPGEGEPEFQNTVDLIHHIKFSRMHIFIYSLRKGTPAADLPDQVDPKTKKERSKYLHKIRNKYMLEFAHKYLNNEVEILVEQKGEGLTSNFIRCFFNDPTDSSGSLKKIFARSVNNSGEIRG
ncbi:MAG: MiaB/RimO family radical SAM methylthiotransferase [Candidatus Margulisiibacteriota bacterium]